MLDASGVASSNVGISRSDARGVTTGAVQLLDQYLHWWWLHRCSWWSTCIRVATSPLAQCSPSLCAVAGGGRRNPRYLPSLRGLSSLFASVTISGALASLRKEPALSGSGVSLRSVARAVADNGWGMDGVLRLPCLWQATYITLYTQSSYLCSGPLLCVAVGPSRAGLPACCYARLLHRGRNQNSQGISQHLRISFLCCEKGGSVSIVLFWLRFVYTPYHAATSIPRPSHSILSGVCPDCRRGNGDREFPDSSLPGSFHRSILCNWLAGHAPSAHVDSFWSTDRRGECSIRRAAVLCACYCSHLLSAPAFVCSPVASY